MKSKLIFIFAWIALISFISMGEVIAQTTIWEEDFQSYSNGTTQGSGSPPKWTRTIPAHSNYFEVRRQGSFRRMEANDLNGDEGVWTSEDIDISGFTNVEISVDISEVGEMEWGDYINLYYKLNGGAETEFSTNGTNSDDFGNRTATQTGLSGNTLVIIIKVNNSSGSEYHRFDDVIVQGEEPGNPGAPSDGGIQPVWVDGNPDCGDLDQLCDCTTGFKPTDPGLGTFTYPDGVSQVTATSSDGDYLDWSSDLPVCCVIVKGGPNANVYKYDPPSYGDGALHPPINPNNNKPYGISHIEYCYNPAPPPQKASISDFVWEDVNKNGIQDNGEPGVEGVTVQLFRCNETTPIATTTTDANGGYAFTDLEPGSYYLKFILPSGWHFTIQNQGGDAEDSDADPTTGVTDCTQLDPGENDVTWDAGIYLITTSINVEKSAVAEVARTWNWTITKSAYPETWDLFKGDQGTSKYTVTVTKTGYMDVITVSGQICVTNNGRIETENLSIFDHVQYNTGGSWMDVTGASVTITPQDQIPGLGSECYDYLFTFDAIPGAAYQNVAEVSIDNGDNKETIVPFSLPPEPTSEVNGTINVDDTNGSSWPTSETASWTYTKTFGCMDDEGAHENTATIRETQQSASASVTVNCHELGIEKDAKTSYKRYYTWWIDKSADKDELELKVCKEADVNYKVVVDSKYEDKDHAVTGTITVTNPAPIPAVINSLEDILPGATNLLVDCSVTFPHTLAAHSSMQCSYSGDLPDATQRTNTATVKLQNYSYAQAPGQQMSMTPIGVTEFSTATAVTFNGPSDKIDECIDVTDSNLGDPLGQVCASDEPPKTFEYTKTYGPYTDADDYVYNNTAMFVTNDTQTEGSDSHKLIIHVPCEPPMADFVGLPTEGFSCLTVEFQSKVSCDVVEWFWDFGDGETSTDENPVHEYCPPVDPKFTVTLTVTNSCGKKTVVTKEKYITVYLHVTAALDAAPTVGYGPLTVKFENKSTGEISTYLWDFGDGTTSTEHSPSHCYTEPGVYTVTLTATGPQESNTTKVKQLIEVYDEAQMPGYLPMVFVAGSDVWSDKEGWDNAVDQDTYWWTGTTNAGSGAWAVFGFADGMEHMINEFRMMTDTRVPEKQGDWVKKFGLYASTTGTADGDFSLIDEFTNTTGGWNEFNFNPVTVKYLKLMITDPSQGWCQVGEIEAYEYVKIADISGSTFTATSPHFASGLDPSVVTVMVADVDGNPVSGLPGSAFRIVADGCINVIGGFEETALGTYVGNFTSIHAGEKTVVVWVYGHRVEYSSLTDETAVIVSFVEPTYELAGLSLVTGTDCYEGDGWDNAYDGDVEGSDAMVSAGPKWGDSYAIFEFADAGTKTIHKYRMMTDVANGWPGHWVTHYQLLVSTTGTDPEDFTLLDDRHRVTGAWEEFAIEPVDVKYIKLVLLLPTGTWRQVGEIEFYTVPTPAMTKELAGNMLSNNSALAAPLTFALQQNYPNPFNPETIIEYHLPAISNVNLNIYNIQGQLVRSLESSIRPAGIHKVIWDSRDERGVTVGSGLYFYQIQATSESGERFTQTNRMILLK